MLITELKEQLANPDRTHRNMADARGTRPIAIGVELHRQIDMELVLQDRARGYRLTKRAFVEEAVQRYLDELKQLRAQYSDDV
jgi:hypothetical protein